MVRLGIIYTLAPLFQNNVQFGHLDVRAQSLGRRGKTEKKLNWFFYTKISFYIIVNSIDNGNNIEFFLTSPCPKSKV